MKWSDADFERMSWHDVHVHGLELHGGEHGAGELMLDLDYILDWICEPGGSCTFRIVPAHLTFHGVYDLKIALDYQTQSAAMGPFSLNAIAREPAFDGGWKWRLEVNWPAGSIEFTARGFTQQATAHEIVKPEQSLTRAERIAD
jgi:hypothetical protein